MTVYMLEFDRPLGNPANKRGQARYYLGSCDDDRLNDRIAEHRAGRGAAITAAAVQRGIGFKVVLTLPGGFEEEKRLKRLKNHRKILERHRS